MQVILERGSELEHRIVITIPLANINQEVEKRLRKIAKDAKMHGFRPGKVPISVIRSRYELVVYDEVVSELMQKGYYDKIKEERLTPIARPEVIPQEPINSNESNESEVPDSITYIAKFEIFPEITLADLESCSAENPFANIEKPVLKIEDADVEEYIKELREEHHVWNVVERVAKIGDQVKIDFKGSCEGEAFDGGEAEGVDLVLGSQTFVSDFEEQLVGSSANDNVEVRVVFPDNYAKAGDLALAGKEVLFDVRIDSVFEKKLPEINKEFLDKLGIVDASVEKFNDDVKEKMLRDTGESIKAITKKKALSMLGAKHKLIIPKSLVKQEINNKKKNLVDMMKEKGMEQFKNIDLPDHFFQKEAEKRVKLGLLINKFIGEYKLEISNDRLDAKIESIAEDYADSKSVISWYKANKDQMDRLRYVMLEEEVVSLVLNKSNVTELPMSYNDILEMDKKLESENNEADSLNDDKSKEIVDITAKNSEEDSVGSTEDALEVSNS